MPADLSINVEDLTIDEIDEIETITGEGIDAVDQPGALKAKLLRAIVFVWMKRTNPNFTMEEAGKIKPATLSGNGNGNGATPNRAARRARPTQANV